MKFILKYKNISVIKMDLLLYPEGIQVLDFTILNEHLLPMGLKPFLLDHDKMMQSYLLSEWLMKRSIPDYRTNIDDFVLSIHHLQKHLFGRMNGYQHTAALLAYLSSGFDHYTLTPEKREIIYLGKQDGRFINLYYLEPKVDYILDDYEISQSINKYLYKPINQAYQYTGYFPTESFTIPSELPSWWERSNDNKILIQECDRLKDKQRAKELLSLLDNHDIHGTREFNGAYFMTDFTNISDYDVTWLGEFVPYLTDSTQIQEQLEILVIGRNCRDVIKQLFSMEKYMKEKGYDIGIYEMGVACNKNSFLPIIIL